ncbi:MAG: efflux RND transporter permease subunit [Bacteroidales bacterium]|jgi:HAE1 family hydrophobic/amphiphilic exporter-1|nr:efflux RND transporter permease subunit [Bacteroidales bacterium]
MAIYKTAINKPITTALIFVAIIVFGIFSFSRLPIDQFPKIDVPYVSIMTTYPGANGSEIETNITKVLENSLSAVDGLKEITSKSKDNMSIISLQLNWGSNIDEAVNDVRSAIDMATNSLPDGASRPMIFKLSTSMMPILQYAITAKESYPGLDKILEENVINVLNRIDGIGNISLSGAPQRYVYIDLDQNKLDAFQLSVEQVGQAVAANNINVASGSIKMGQEQYQLRVQSEYMQSSDINDIVVANRGGKVVFVRDLATVRDTIRDVTVDERINGQHGTRLVIMKQTGANTVEVAREVRRMMEQIRPTLPADIQFKVIYDGAQNIENSIHGLSEAVMFAFLFVILMVLFFLGRWRATFIIILSIPISLVCAFIYLYIADSSINIISLCSLTIAVGLVVDDAIVVLENITRHVERGSAPREAAIYGTNEVWVSVIATTMVIVAVFFPLTMLGGQAGIMFKELGWIVSITIVVSAVVAISLTPMLASRLIRNKKVIINAEGKVEEVSTQSNLYEKTVMKWLAALDQWYARKLHWCLNHKLITSLAAVIIMVACFIPACTGRIGFNFMAEQDNGQLSATIEVQRGTRVEETMKIARQIEVDFMALAPEIELISTSTGASDEATFAALMGSSNNNTISMIIRFPTRSKRERSVFEIAEILRQYLSQRADVVNSSITSGGFMGGQQNTVDVEIFGYDFETTNRLTETLRSQIRELPGARNITVSREEDRAELQVLFDKEKLARSGLTSQQVSLAIRNRVNGFVAGFFKEDGDEYDIVVRLKEEFRSTISDIENMTLQTPTGALVKVSELATVQEFWSPPTIERKSRQRIVTISVTPVGVSLAGLAAEIEKVVAANEIPQGVLVNVGGTYEDQMEMAQDMATLMLLIILLVYIVMASQFESFAKPFLILLGSIPFAFAGAMLALYITGVNLEMVGMLGMVLLVGIVVKNGIVLVDYINLMRDRGYELHEAIAMSGESRLRPVLMTALTAILGMVPMALSTAEGSEMWVPLGIVVIGGLLFATVVTLVIVPVLYAAISRHGERDKEAEIRKSYIFFDQKLSDEDMADIQRKY